MTVTATWEELDTSSAPARGSGAVLWSITDVSAILEACRSAGVLVVQLTKAGGGVDGGKVTTTYDIRRLTFTRRVELDGSKGPTAASSSSFSSKGAHGRLRRVEMSGSLEGGDEGGEAPDVTGGDDVGFARSLSTAGPAAMEVPSSAPTVGATVAPPSAPTSGRSAPSSAHTSRGVGIKAAREEATETEDDEDEGTAPLPPPPPPLAVSASTSTSSSGSIRGASLATSATLPSPSAMSAMWAAASSMVCSAASSMVGAPAAATPPATPTTSTAASKPTVLTPDGSADGTTTTTTTATAAAPPTTAASLTTSASASSHVPPVAADLVAAQVARGAQSLRKQAYDLGPTVSKDKHGKGCFDKMLAREKQLCGEWAVFYHSYSYAALLYEVQAAVAAVLFRFKSTFATLPRLLKEPFNDIPDAPALQAAFQKFKDRDHNTKFRAVGISGTSSLLAADSEAPPKTCFLHGYSCTDVSFVGVLENLLVSCGVPARMKTELAAKIIQVSEKHGLDCSQFKGKRCASGRAGHMLQIFIKRSLVDRYAYAALPYGVTDTTRPVLSTYLEGPGPIQGQIRIVTNPSVFMRGSAVRMYVGSADPEFHENRPAFQEELTRLLQPIIGTPEVRTKAAEGIYAGRLPPWFNATDYEDQTKPKP